MSYVIYNRFKYYNLSKVISSFGPASFWPWDIEFLEFWEKRFGVFGTTRFWHREFLYLEFLEFSRKKIWSFWFHEILASRVSCISSFWYCDFLVSGVFWPRVFRIASFWGYENWDSSFWELEFLGARVFGIVGWYLVVNGIIMSKSLVFEWDQNLGFFMSFRRKIVKRSPPPWGKFWSSEPPPLSPKKSRDI